MVLGVEPLIDRLESPPDRIPLAVPAKFVCVDQPPRRHAGDNHPGKESVAGRSSQVARGLPASAADVIELECRIVGKRKLRFGLRSSKVERDHGVNPLVERRGYGRGIAASGDGSQQEDPLGIDAWPLQQQIDARASDPRPSSRSGFLPRGAVASQRCTGSSSLAGRPETLLRSPSQCGTGARRSPCPS